jgi:FdhD protein
MIASEPLPQSADGTSWSTRVARVQDGVCDTAQDSVAEEVPIALEYNGISHVVMLATPADLEDFAIGFSLSEGIVDSVAEIYDIETESSQAGITLQIRVATERFAALKERRRNLAGRTGCGLCGVDSLAQVVRSQASVQGSAQFAPDVLLEAMARMRRDQHLMSLTGAVHGAAWLDATGNLAWLREDVGRHNALDKLIGAAARAGNDFSRGAALITSRASFEMVQKSVALGITLLAAVSAPTGLAIRAADAAQLTLVGFARESSLVCYTHPARLGPLVARTSL